MRPLVLAAALTASIWAGVTFPAITLTVLAGLLTVAGVYDVSRGGSRS